MSLLSFLVGYSVDYDSKDQYLYKSNNTQIWSSYYWQQRQNDSTV